MFLGDWWIVQGSPCSFVPHQIWHVRGRWRWDMCLDLSHSWFLIPFTLLGTLEGHYFACPSLARIGWNCWTVPCMICWIPSPTTGGRERERWQSLAEYYQTATQFMVWFTSPTCWVLLHTNKISAHQNHMPEENVKKQLKIAWYAEAERGRRNNRYNVMQERRIK